MKTLTVALLASAAAFAGGPKLAPWTGELQYGMGLVKPDSYMKVPEAKLPAETVKYLKYYALAAVERAGEGGSKVLWSSTDASTDSLGALTTGEKRALLAFLQQRPLGAEADLLIAEADGKLPVTLSWDVETKLTLRSGPVFKPVLSSEVTPAQLKEKYGIGEFTEEDAKWDPVAFAAVDRALGLLSKEELALVKNLTFRRTKEMAPHAALYVRGEQGTHLYVFDKTFVGDADFFTGDPAAPLPWSAGVVLHELGHAIADLRMRELCETSVAAKAEYARVFKESNDLAAEYNAKAPTATDDKGKAELKAIDDKLTLAKADSAKKAAEANALVVLIGQLDGAKASTGRAAEAALAKVMDPKKAPTAYGKKSPTEAFAESFRIYKTDLPALKRVVQPSADWFATGEYLKLSLKPLK